MLFLRSKEAVFINALPVCITDFRRSHNGFVVFEVLVRFAILAVFVDVIQYLIKMLFRVPRIMIQFVSEVKDACAAFFCIPLIIDIADLLHVFLELSYFIEDFLVDSPTDCRK